MTINRKRVCLTCTVSAIVAFSLALAPMSFADAKVRTGTNSSSFHSQQRQEEGLGIESNTPPSPENTDEANSAYHPSITITDEATGITVTGTLDNPLTDESNVFIETGENALHAQGECAACDEMRTMASGGYDIQIIKPCASTVEEGGKIGIRVPISFEHASLTPRIYICEGGELIQVEPTMVTSEDVRVAAKNQMPLAITFEAPDDSTQAANENAGESSSTKIPTVIPDDDEPDDGDEGEEEDQNPIIYVAIILLAVIILVSTFIALDKKQAKN